MVYSWQDDCESGLFLAPSGAPKVIMHPLQCIGDPATAPFCTVTQIGFYCINAMLSNSHNSCNSRNKQCKRNSEQNVNVWWQQWH